MLVRPACCLLLTATAQACHKVLLANPCSLRKPYLPPITAHQGILISCILAQGGGYHKYTTNSPTLAAAQNLFSAPDSNPNSGLTPSGRVARAKRAAKSPSVRKWIVEPESEEKPAGKKHRSVQGLGEAKPKRVSMAGSNPAAFFTPQLEELARVSVLTYNVWFNEPVALQARMDAIGRIIEDANRPDVLMFQVRCKAASKHAAACSPEY